MTRLKNSKEAAVFRKELLEKQEGIDPILGIPIEAPVLDHMHYPPWKCRGVLQNEMNALEGRIANAYRRYCSHLTDKPLPEVLRALADYLEKDYSQNPIHHTALTDEMRLFKKLDADKQKELLISLGLEPRKNLKGRCLQMRKALREGKISYEEFV